MTIHLLKAWPSHLQAMADGHKKVDVRKNDRDFVIADYLLQYEWTPPRGKVTGRILVQQVTHLLTGNGVQEGYVAMSVTELTEKEADRVVTEFFGQNYIDTPTALTDKLFKLGKLPPFKRAVKEPHSGVTGTNDSTPRHREKKVLSPGIAANLTWLMHARDVSAVEIEEATGIHNATISRWKNGERQSPSGPELATVARYLGTTSEALLSEDPLDTFAGRTCEP